MPYILQYLPSITAAWRRHKELTYSSFTQLANVAQTHINWKG